MHRFALQGTIALNALSTDSDNALTRGEEMAVEKEGDHSLDRPFDLAIAPLNIY